MIQFCDIYIGKINVNLMMIWVREIVFILRIIKTDCMRSEAFLVYDAYCDTFYYSLTFSIVHLPGTFSFLNINDSEAECIKQQRTKHSVKMTWSTQIILIVELNFYMHLVWK